MLFRTTRWWALGILPLIHGLTACGEDSPDPLPASLVQFADAPESECPSGGRLVVSGIDLDGNGTLEGDQEVQSTVAVCNGQTGEQGVPGTDALVRSTEEPEGENCDLGGIRIDVGADADGDGTLSEGEIEQTTFACNGPDGQDGLRTLTRTETVGQPECEEAGVRIEYGLDRNENGELDTDEITSSELLCEGGDGQATLVDVDEEPPGQNCTIGGLRVSSGLDVNGDRVLDEAEVTEVSFVCDPVRSVVRVRTSTTCENGGSRIETGPDLDGDGQLDDAEVNEVTNVCSGEAAGRSLVVTTPEPAGMNCAAGGEKVEIGFDTDGDGILQASEIGSTSYVCNGERGDDGTGGNAVRITTVPNGDPECPNGGTQIETGPDSNGNGNLDDSEVTNTTYSCNGNATTTLVDVVDIAAAPNGPCGLEGGQRIWTGVDDDGDGVLDVSERDTSRDVCDTTTGTGVPFQILTVSLPDGFTSVSYEREIEAVGGTAGGYTWQLLGDVPPGLTIGTSGTPTTDLSGTITATGTFTFTIRVEDTFQQFDEETYTIDVAPPPCTPGQNGLAGTTRTDVTVPSSFGFGIRSIAADSGTSTTGWVYHVDPGDDLLRFQKDGSTDEDVLPLVSGLAAGDLNTVMIDGDDIYVSSDDLSCESECIQRISDDGGATFSLVDLGDFAATTAGDTNDDIRGMAVVGTTLYAITHDSAETEVYSLDLTGTFPVVPTLEATIGTIEYCSGLAADDDFLYTACDDIDETGTEGIVRIDTTTFTAEVQELDLNFGTGSYADLAIQDPDGDGAAEVLWIQGDSGASFYACDPQSAIPVFGAPFGTGADDDEGLAYDPQLNAIWQIEESSTTAYRFE